MSLVRVLTIGVTVSAGSPLAQEPLYPGLAERAVSTMGPTAGERVLIRADPKTMGGFEPVLRAAFRRAGAQVETIAERDVRRFDERLENTDIYVWMPGASALTSPEQRLALERWVDRGGTRRELHFHWSEGTMTPDGGSAPHGPDMDRLYAEALDIDYAALNTAQEAAIALLRSGEVRVTTPAGTDLRFRTANRPFNKQNGDGSKARMKAARMRIDRHIELPAGIVRVAPVETSVRGVLVIPALQYGDGFGAVARGVRLQFAAGKVVKVDAGERTTEVGDLLREQPALASFREIGVGFNPKLAAQPASKTVPYYGYGAGFVRLSLGNNEELGGLVRGRGVMWNFFSDATITVAGRTLVKNGKVRARYSVTRADAPSQRSPQRVTGSGRRRGAPTSTPGRE
jgi:hypothetical protein